MTYFCPDHHCWIKKYFGNPASANCPGQNLLNSVQKVNQVAKTNSLQHQKNQKWPDQTVLAWALLFVLEFLLHSFAYYLADCDCRKTRNWSDSVSPEWYVDLLMLCYHIRTSLSTWIPNAYSLSIVWHKQQLWHKYNQLYLMKQQYLVVDQKQVIYSLSEYSLYTDHTLFTNMNVDTTQNWFAYRDYPRTGLQISWNILWAGITETFRNGSGLEHIGMDGTYSPPKLF